MYLLHSTAVASGKSIEIWIGQNGRVYGKIAQNGTHQNARIKGLPEFVRSEQIVQVQKYLQQDSYLTCCFDEIIINTRGRGGIEPVSIAICLVASGVATGVGYGIARASDYFFPPKPNITVTGDNSPVTIIERNGDGPITAQHGNNPQSHSTVTNYSADINPYKVLAVGTAGAAAYGVYYYIQHRRRNTVNLDGNTPLHLAVLDGNIAAVKQLLNFDAVLGYFRPMSNVDAQNQAGDTALHLAIRGGHAGIIDILRQKNANVYLSNLQREIPYNMASSSSSDAVRAAIGIPMVAHPTAEHQ